MISRSLFTVLVLVILSAANPLRLEEALVLPAGWRKLDTKPKPDQKLHLSFALRQPEIESIKKKITSRGENFGSHLAYEDAQSLRDPDQADVDSVLAWLEEYGLAGQATTIRDWIHVKTTVQEAESFLKMDLNYFQFEDKRPVLRTQEYFVPEGLSEAISFVHPIANFMRPKRELGSVVSDATPKMLETHSELDKRAEGCNLTVTPACLRDLYNISYSPTDGESSIRLGIAGFLEQYANYRDSDLFLETLAPDLYAKGYNYSVELVNGGQNSQNLFQSGAEAALDVQYALALGHPTNITYYLSGGRGAELDDNGEPLSEEESENEPYLEFLEYLLDLTDERLPHVLSISYADDEVSVPLPYAIRVCNLLGVLTSRGTTVLVASGDGGARGSSDSKCRTNDGTDKDVAMSVFPGSCPWVTAVGAVKNVGDPPDGAEYSGGGFSQYFKRPSWQDAAVSSYVTELDGFMSGYYDPNFRALPDISAVGSSFMVKQAGQTRVLRGTSASTPVIAAMIALIDDARVRQGKPVLGWLNGILYTEEARAVLQDITGGQSLSCNFREGGLIGGWPAKRGWDAITGLGVPYDFQKLFDVLVEV
ncbi:peptidase S8/S53 domain-containing protein [Dactylonectria macrodidyma]|uniref:tripeptidyl-peptidase II n=1 Tax=Dactylonectria macrodidyma TaxID=307937 RepID=A0A9P9FRZ9_9HYPO|nr:peptidase S8/S53 domain-containing protein [Dactylonectria macrodidyma]